jgi:ankyrin repeat protein
MKTQINFEQLQNDLYYAVRDHDFAQVESLISLGASVNGLIPILGVNDNILAFACRNSNGLEIVKLLVKNHANVNNINPEAPSSCPLTQAAMSSFEITKFLIESGAEVNPNIPFYSPLLLAVDVGQDINTVKLLIEKGANVNGLQSSFGRTALHVALRSSKFEMAKLLIQNGANTNIQEHGESAIDLLERFSNNSAQAQELLELVSKEIAYVTQITSTAIDIPTHVDITPVTIIHQPMPLQIPIEEISGPKKPDHHIYSNKIKQSSLYYRDQIKISNEDYNKIVNKVGDGAPSGTKVKILKDGYKYVCTFKQEAKNLDLSKYESIGGVNSASYDNTVVTFCKAGITGGHLIIEAENYQHPDLQAKFFDHCIKHGQQAYKYNSFIVRSQQQVRDESDSQGNIPEIEKNQRHILKMKRSISLGIINQLSQKYHIF